MAGLPGVLDVRVMGDGRYVGAAAREGGTHVYGGHSFAQALLAAARSLGDGWICYAAQVQFLRVGRPASPIEHLVEPTSIGRGFAVQRVVSTQQDRPIMLMTASFQRTGYGPDFQAETASDAPSPDRFENEADRFRRFIMKQGLADDIQLLPSGIDGRWTDPQDLEDPIVKPAWRQIWLRASDSIENDPNVQQAALAYCSDFSFIETALRPLGISWHRPPTMFATSLQHSVWFHRPTDFAQWHLCSSLCPTIQAGRAFIRGEIHDGQGRLVASLAQDGLVRPG